MPGSLGEFFWVLFVVLALPAGVIALVLYLANSPLIPNLIKQATTPLQKPVTSEEFSNAVVNGYWKQTGSVPHDIERLLIGLALSVYRYEGFGEEPEPLSLTDPDTAEKMEKQRSRLHAPIVLDAANELGASLVPLLHKEEATSVFRAQLPTDHLAADAEQLRSTFRQRRHIFSRTAEQFEQNRAIARDLKDPWEQQLSMFRATPLLDFATLLSARTEPLSFDQYRFRHQFVVGPTGSGKTTFLSAQINADLDKVARGEACVFVMDSQNELIPNLANLARFAPGGDLAGKLIYLEPDPDYPLALNIFDLDQERLSQLSGRDRTALIRGTEEMVTFFLKSLVRAETSGFMEAIIKYVLRGVMLIPNATIFTFKDLLSKGSYAKYEQYLSQLSENDRNFLKSEMFESGYAASLNAMRSRFAAFTGDKLFTDMFSYPRNRLDFFHMLQTPRVILVNTMEGMLKGAKEPFGRFFIAKLLQATEERMFLPKASKLPVYAYIDEAQDYLRNEENIAELIEKARKQNVAITVATHSPEEFDPRVARALEKAAIQARGQNAPNWQLSLSGAAPVTVQVENVNFGDMPRMSKRSFDLMRRVMQKHFSVPKDEHIITPSPPTSAPLPKDPDSEPDINERWTP